MFNLPQITAEQLDEFLDEIEGLRSVAKFLAEDGVIDYEKLLAESVPLNLDSERAQRGSRRKFEAALAKVAATEPDEADRL